MKLSQVLAAITLLSLNAFAPAQAAGRGGWDGNGTSASGLAQGQGSAQVRTSQRAAPIAGDEVQAGGRGGWDANGTSVSGLAGGGDAKVRAVQQPTVAAPAP
jgi:hypothetical protein